ncbi:nucleoside hydrolase [Alicyclobacillus sp.]|uniref:nucleoside hydrolase n=1 Tax=Alicyclobacillus sp. TaxID=61169 RepID=UPI0025BEF2E1|nr:nucleoside hydrolase [Alicyclobacillus sp.]MCL6516404.1 nucleoside hydrolase [Alicyclobacillus sp.]
MERTRIILDVDTGVDDALAILYALRSPGLDVLGITTCFGNVDVDRATRNTLAVVELCGLDVPVYRGAERPILREWTGPVPWIHGEDGLGNTALPAPRRRAESQEAASFLREAIRRHPGEVALVPVARLTNVARAFLFDPELPRLVRGVVFMGGAAFCPGNVTAVAEANVWGDPEAAEIVLQSGAPLTMVGLDVTMRARLEAHELDRLNPALPHAALVRDAVSFYMNAYEETQGVRGRWCPLHDPLAVAVAEDPTLCTTRPYPVRISCDGATAGMTVVDARPHADKEPNVAVCVDVDVDRFLGRFRERLGMS